jgi:glutamate 5-kinase
MTGVDGDFSRGEVIAILDSQGEVARGSQLCSRQALICCAASHLAKCQVLGYATEPEMVHHGNLVLSNKKKPT